MDGVKVLDKLNLLVNNGDKIAFVGPNHLAKTVLFEIISGNMQPDDGEFTWGVTTSRGYFPKNNDAFFREDLSITDWLGQYVDDADETYLRSFLGRMLFSGDEALKSCKVLSGGEKVRCVLAKLMLEGANCLIFDEPTSHLDLEAIQSLNNGLIDFTGVVMFNSHDHQFVDSIANRIIEFTPNGLIDRYMKFDDYISDTAIKSLRMEMYGSNNAVAL